MENTQKSQPERAERSIKIFLSLAVNYAKRFEISAFLSSIIYYVSPAFLLLR